MLVGGGRSQGLILTCLIGVAGALGGGWAACKLFHIHTLHGFFNLDAWLTAIAGAAVLLLVYHLATGRSGTCSLLTASAAVICCCAGPVAAMGKKSSGSWPGRPPVTSSRRSQCRTSAARTSPHLQLRTPWPAANGLRRRRSG